MNSCKTLTLTKIEQKWLKSQWKQISFDIALTFAFKYNAYRNWKFSHPFNGYDALFRYETQQALSLVDKIISADFDVLTEFDLYLYNYPPSVIPNSVHFDIDSELQDQDYASHQKAMYYE